MEVSCLQRNMDRDLFQSFERNSMEQNIRMSSDSLSTGDKLREIACRLSRLHDVYHFPDDDMIDDLKKLAEEFDEQP